MVIGIQCINTDCLQFTRQEEAYCPNCGSELILDGRFKPYKLLSDLGNPWSYKASRKFEAIELKTMETVIIWVVNSADPSITTPLLEAVLALREIHGMSVKSGVMQLIKDRAYFTRKILPDGPNAHFMVSQKVKGSPLDQWLEINGPINQRLSVDWLIQLILAADVLHQEGFLHRDIKPQNIMVTEDMQLVLIDLDAVCFIDPTESMNSNIAEGNEPYPILGSIGFMAPEQSEGKPIPASDYYSIGLTIINLVTGIHPSDLPRVDSLAGRLNWREQAPQISSKFADFLDLLSNPNQLYRPSIPERIIEYISDPSVISNSHASRETSSRFKFIFKHLRLVRLLVLGLLLSVSIKAGAAYHSLSGMYATLEESNQLLEIGDNSSAIQLLEAAVREYPRSANLRQNLGFAYLNSGNQEKAIDNFELALKIDESPINYYNLGSILELSDLSLAIRYYQAAIYTSAEGSAVRFLAQNNIARLHLLNGELQEAEQLLNSIDVEKIEGPVSRAIVLKNRGWLLREQGNSDQALDALNQSIEADPTRPDAYCLMALITGNEDDRITCLSLYNPIDKPEIRLWKAELLRTH